jgi:hypothetical protein
MKIFGRTGGYYLFWCSFIYLVTGLTFAVYYKAVPTEVLQIIWIVALALPFAVPPVGRYFNLDVEWDIKMFDWMKKDKTPSNVVPFPEQPKPVPYVEPAPEPEKPVHTYYRLGLTNNNRVSFQMGYSEITMNAAGIDSMIKLLESYRDLLSEGLDEQE